MVSLRELVMSDTQFDNMTERCRRNLIERCWKITTPKYVYSLGANSMSNCWLLIRKVRYSPVDQPKSDFGTVCWDRNTEVIDRWR